MSDVLIYHQAGMATSDGREIEPIDFELKEIGPKKIDAKYIEFEVVGPASFIESRAKGKPSKKITLNRETVAQLRGKQVEATERAKLASENEALKRRIAELEANAKGGTGVDPSKIVMDATKELTELTKKELLAIAAGEGLTLDPKATKTAIIAAIEDAAAAEAGNEGNEDE